MLKKGTVSFISRGGRAATEKTRLAVSSYRRGGKKNVSFGAKRKQQRTVES